MSLVSVPVLRSGVAAAALASGVPPLPERRKRPLGAVTPAVKASASMRPSTSAASRSSVGDGTPSRRSVAASRPTPSSASLDCPSSSPMCFAEHALAEQLAGAAVAAALGYDGGDEVAGAGQPGERLLVTAAAARERVDLGEDLARGGAGGVRSADARDGGGQRGRVLRGARELDAGDVARRGRVEAGLLEHARDLRGEDRVLAADDERGAAGQRVERVARTADAGDGARVGALGDVAGGQHPVGRDEALAEHDDAGVRLRSPRRARRPPPAARLPGRRSRRCRPGRAPGGWPSRPSPSPAARTPGR